MVSTLAAEGADIVLDGGASRHVKVLRMQPGDEIEIVDSGGNCWLAKITDLADAVKVVPIAVVTSSAPDANFLGSITLYVGVPSAGSWSTLLADTTAAGVSRIVPIVPGNREARRIHERIARDTRVLTAAAQQCKRTTLPEICEPLTWEDLCRENVERGILLSPAGDTLLIDGVQQVGTTKEISICVGGPGGVSADVESSLKSSGWLLCSIGRTILRTELASAIAVSIAMQHHQRRLPAGK